MLNTNRVTFKKIKLYASIYLVIGIIMSISITISLRYSASYKAAINYLELHKKDLNISAIKKEFFTAGQLQGNSCAVYSISVVIADKPESMYVLLRNNGNKNWAVDTISKTTLKCFVKQF
jgi:hypothetical protein